MLIFFSVRLFFVHQYLARVNITHASDGGRNMGILALYAAFTLGLVFVFMWARARPKKKKTKTKTA